MDWKGTEHYLESKPTGSVRHQRSYRRNGDGVTNESILVWFRRDLRLEDNPALAWACKTGRPLVPFYLMERDSGNVSGYGMGSASKWWLNASLSALADAMTLRGSQLTLRHGKAIDEVDRLVEETGATTIVWNRRYEPLEIAADAEVALRMKFRGVSVRTFNGSLLVEPWEISSKSGKPYQVFGPFWRNWSGWEMPRPIERGVKWINPSKFPHSDDRANWDLVCHSPYWAREFHDYWTPGESGAREKLRLFCSNAVNQYHLHRDLPGLDSTSRLSPHLHFGEIGPRQIVYSLKSSASCENVETFLRQLAWREFSYHVVNHNPGIVDNELSKGFDQVPWSESQDEVRNWRIGLTGYPLVDAGMRQLWRTGWMHNRVRMVVASFLVKHLMTDWRLGRDWFWDTLVDANNPSNLVGWHWVTGSGHFASPYFRICNPVVQSRRFDPNGHYLRTFLPELENLPPQYIHAPWEAPSGVLRDSKVILGVNYPFPIIDHSFARWRALRVYERYLR